MMRKPMIAVLLLLAASQGARANGYCSCDISIPGVNFGSYDPISSVPTDASSTVHLTCRPFNSNQTVGYSIALSTGAGSYGLRQMRAQGSPLLYNVFLDATHTVPWGNGTAGTAAVSGTVSGGNVTTSRAIPVFGEIPAGQQAAPGSYSDILIATISF